MALVKCDECGHVVSHTAKVCPNCGFDFKAALRKLYRQHAIQELQELPKKAWEDLKEEQINESKISNFFNLLSYIFLAIFLISLLIYLVEQNEGEASDAVNSLLVFSLMLSPALHMISKVFKKKSNEQKPTQAVSPLNQSDTESSEQKPTQAVSPLNQSDTEMEKYGITYDGTKYTYKTYRYDKLSDAIAYAKLETQRS